MKEKKLKFSDDVVSLLRSGEWKQDGDEFLFSMPPVSRELYVDANKALIALGGKWNRSKKAHAFDHDVRDEIENFSGEIIVEDYSFFPTPHWLADLMRSFVNIKSWHLILEPSAGDGALLYGLDPNKVKVVELNPQRAKYLRDQGYDVHEGDFLEVKPTPAYDVVLMNPPFEVNNAIRHVLHAYNFLKPDGELIAIVPSTIPGADRTGLHQLLNSIIDHHGRWIRQSVKFDDKHNVAILWLKKM